ncbi:hypothetical protein PHMEG_00014883 [Phytophthora megakarya]|uniref:Carbohydrate-binding protein n=1 Tax=Phytophthora megakarya TaxID=4795 RepID=A0A225W2N7_9STRA|nr:hypothetical protein PHMEG_00014883 [Phytophthora megakarya]
MLCAGLKFRWVVMVTVALALVATATECNVTNSKTLSTSASSDTNVGQYGGDDGNDPIFGTLDFGGNDNGWGHQQGCTEEAMWCPSLNTALSRDPNHGCQFPPCPS